VGLAEPQRHDIAHGDTTMTTTTNPRRDGLLVHPDDLQVGRFYAIHGAKHSPDEWQAISGQSFQIKAMSLPFIVGQLASDPAQPITLDVRHLNLMGVTKEFSDAQRRDTGHNP
jgi:hypothetical protein